MDFVDLKNIASELQSWKSSNTEAESGLTMSGVTNDIGSISMTEDYSFLDF